MNMNSLKSVALLFTVLLTGFYGKGQHSEPHANGSQHILKGSSRLSLGLGHTNVSEGKSIIKTMACDAFVVIEF